MSDDQERDEAPAFNNASKPKNSNKKIFAIFAALIAVLVIALIALMVMLFSKDDDTAKSGESSSSAQTSEEETSEAESGSRAVLKRVPTANEKLEYVIYEPEQNANNTTLFFAIENVCEGCSDSETTYYAVSDFADDDDSYLLDDNNGKKYSPITDQDGEVLATPSCGGSLDPGSKQECFVAFSKVPSGSTVSWVFGDTRIDGIKIQ